jgi:CarboxypepD_reg-like domain
MRTYLLTLAPLLLCTLTLAQSWTIRGKVTDKESGQPLSGASVVCMHTTFGTTTNADGEFSLTLDPGGYDLAVSFNGYATESNRISSNGANGPLNVMLGKKQQSLEEVSVVVSNEVKDGWDKYGAFFREQFLGMTPNSAHCVIENPGALKFYYNKKKNKLKVTAKEELQITNPALGYRIRYQLDSFTHEYATGNTQYTGFPFFEEMHGASGDSLAWQEARLTAYYGSLLHFMRCYYDSTLAGNGYKLELVDGVDKARSVRDPYDSSFYGQTGEHEIELRFPGKLRVVYLEEKPDKAYLEYKKLSPNTTVQVSILSLADAIIVEENGYFYEQKDVLSLGYWSWEKLADFLPYNYDPPPGK